MKTIFDIGEKVYFVEGLTLMHLPVKKIVICADFEKYHFEGEGEKKGIVYSKHCFEVRKTPDELMAAIFNTI